MRFAFLLSLSLLLPRAIARPWNTSDPCPERIKARISSDPCDNLSLDGEYFCRNDEIQMDTSMDTVHSILRSCPNITSLELKVGLQGSFAWPDRYNFPFNRSGTDTYPGLKKLKLIGYDFGSYREATIESSATLGTWLKDVQRPFTQEMWRSLLQEKIPIMETRLNGDFAAWAERHILDDFAQFDQFSQRKWKAWIQEQVPVEEIQHKSNFVAWLDAMDWSKIEDFGLYPGPTEEMLEILPSTMTRLRKLEMTDMTFLRALENHTLTHITWLGPKATGESTITDILAHQGQSLESLEFRCDEKHCPSLPSYNISILPEMAPNLRHIAVNLQRNGTWPYENLATIASMPHLETAHIYMNLQGPCAQNRSKHIVNYYSGERIEYDKQHDCSSEASQFQQPYLTERAALELYEFMQAQKKTGELGRVHFRVGNFARPDTGLTRPNSWIEFQRTEVVCDQHGKGEGEAWCKLNGPPKYWSGIEGEYWIHLWT